MNHTDDNDVFVPGELIGKLSEAYQALLERSLAWRDISDADHHAGYEVFVPTFDTDDTQRRSLAARQQAVTESTGLTIDDALDREFGAGLICASKAVVSAVDAMNKAKSDFKDTVMEIRALASGQPSVSRDKYLKKAMKSAGIQTLHLRECYRHIRIMPPNLEVFAWTWATSHARIQKLSFDGAVKLAEGLRDRDEMLADMAIDILHKRCSPDEILARRVPLPNQMRANYAYREDGELIRNSCPLSGVVIAQQKTLPRLVWRPNPVWSDSQPARLPRESIMEKDPLIEVLALYRYVHHDR
ncbi:hypothetical protein MIH18_23045 (plasmid) [Marinobacter sp. M3C]|jgi:hypothetical protein|uniref:hypothetical protein n=1 Tax=Marinobacter sp. M3C TaxID=2917715 RepID=UPI0020108DAF|nr:hypothetical protein [Marinobacter sp. M3C]UQG62608.1 hypothetical protein MIH18_23045 [Marinobacter sp. M3C]